jgi:prepilin-type N-terminal cleavage/methylation domain-containing protein
MRIPLRHKCFPQNGGFTLLEVMVSLLLGALMLGGLMGLISASLQYGQRLKEKSQVQPLLESAAEEILANPEKAVAGSITVGTEPNVARINVRVEKEELPEFKRARTDAGELYRVLLEYSGQLLEFSIYVTPSDVEK